MENKRELNDHLVEMENALLDLAPTPARLDTAATLFLAGQEAARCERQRHMFWPALSACLAVACIGLGVLVARPSAPQIVYVPVERSTDTETPQPQDSTPQDSTPQDNQPAAPERQGPSRTMRHPDSRHAAQLAADRAAAASWQDLMTYRHEQTQAMSVAIAENLTDSTAEEPVIIKAVNRSDWPLLLTDQDVGERFRTLAAPLQNQATPAIQYWTSLF